MEQFPTEAPVVPLRNAVLFPGGILPIGITEELRQTIAADPTAYVVVVAQRDQSARIVTAGGLFEVGTLSRIVKVDRTKDAVILHGLVRCLVQVRPGHASLRAHIETIDSEGVLDEVSSEELRTLGVQLVHRTPGIPDAAKELVREVRDPVHLLDLLIANADLSVAEKQWVLEARAIPDRARLAKNLLSAAVARLPTAQITGSQCAAHQAPAVGACARCGAFICDGCRPFVNAPDICPPCQKRNREDASNRRLRPEDDSTALWLAPISLVLLLAFPASKGLSMFFAASGVLVALHTLWLGRNLPMEVAPRGLMKTVFALVLNAILVAAILWLVRHPAGS